MQLSSLLQRFNEPETLKMAKLGRELRAKGFDITDLSLGEPDFDTPDHIKIAAKKAIDENYSHYTPVAGYLDLREAVCGKLKRDNNLEYTPDQVIVSTGAKQSIFNAVMSIVDLGDEVIIPTPYWVTYSEIVRMAGGAVKFVNTSINNGYKITPAELESAISNKTKLFMFSSPCNPSGAVYSKAELTALAEVFKKHPAIFIMSDEIYEFINYDGEHYSIAQFDFLKDRVILVNGLSKAYAMTGWRLGYTAAPKKIADAIDTIQSHTTSNPTTFAQFGAIAALQGDQQIVADMRDEFDVRRQYMLGRLEAIKNVKVVEPLGAFYFLVNIEPIGIKSVNFCEKLLSKAKVAAVPGVAFGSEHTIRFSYATGLDVINAGMDRFEEFCAQH